MTPTKPTNKEKTEGFTALPMDAIKSPEHPERSHIEKDKLQSLTDSIKTVGLLQPIAVNKTEDGYEIIHGERRYLAHMALGRTEINTIVHNWESDKVFLARMHENLGREDISPVDEAKYINLISTKFDYSNDKIAALLNKSPAWISQRLAILKYPEILYTALLQGKLTFSVAREFSKIRDPLTLNTYITSAIDSGITPTVATRWVTEHLARSGQLQNHSTQPTTPINESEFITPQGTCHICEQKGTYTELTTIWIHNNCLAEVFKLLVEVHLTDSKHTDTPTPTDP